MIENKNKNENNAKTIQEKKEIKTMEDLEKENESLKKT